MMNLFGRVFLGFSIFCIGLCGVGFCLSGLTRSPDNTAVFDSELDVQRKFVVVVASYKNEEYYKRNLDSIFDQTYTNYRVIYVDDFSPDRTYELVSSYIKERGVEDKVHLIKNEENLKAMYNLYTMIHMCDNDEIVVILDGDDWFADERVLERLNRYYANEDVWLTYGQYKRHPDNQIGMCKPDLLRQLQKAKFRELDWHYSHLRTFYAGLFKRIRIADLFYNGNFYNTTYDLAIMYPMMEMAREHTFFIPDIMYVYNYQTPLNDEKIRRDEQIEIEKHIRSLPKYMKLDCHPATPIPTRSQEKADLVVFSYNRPMQLYAFLESFKKHVTGYGNVAVVFRSDSEFDSGYDIVKRDFLDVLFIEQSKEVPKEDFRRLTIEATFKGEAKSKYVLFAVDDIIITGDIDLSQDIQSLDNTGAHGFFYRLGQGVDYCYSENKIQGVPKLLPVEEDAYVWSFFNETGDWKYPNSLDFVLYNKELIQKEIESLNFTNPNYFEGHWARLAPYQKLGICHKAPKLVNVPANIVTTSNRNRSAHFYTVSELNTLFLEGLKIDLTPFLHREIRASHSEIEYDFIPRLWEERIGG